jgi:ketosteroid isomerase-like protein
VAVGDAQVVRDAWARWLRDGPEAILPYLDAEIEWTPPQDEPDSATHRGRAAVVGLLTAWREAFAELRADPIEFEEVGGRVVISVVYCARAHGGDAVIETSEAHVVRLRDGKIVEVQGFRTLEQARRTLGRPP